MNDPSPSTVNVMLDGNGLPPLPRGESVWRHPLFVLLVGALTVMALALICVTFALIAVNGAKNDVQGQLGCSRKYSTATSNAQAQVLGGLGDAQSVILDVIGASSSGDQAAVAELVAQTPALATALDTATDNLNKAIDAQEASLKICT